MSKSPSCGGRLMALALVAPALIDPPGAHARSEDESHDHDPPSGTVEADPFGGAPTLSRAALAEEVLRRNPTVEAARAGWIAARARGPQEDALEDPMLSYEIAPGSVFDREVRLGHTVRLEQRFPFPGTRRLRAEAAEAESDRAREMWEATRRRTALMASVLFDEYFAAYRAAEINQRHRELMQDLKRSAEAQYAVGRAAQQDPLQAEVEIADLLHEELAIEVRKAVARARLNGLLHRAPYLPLPPPPLELEVDMAPPPPSETLFAMARAGRPEVKGAAAETREGQAMVALARRAAYPDFGVMGSYSSMWMEPAHQYMVGISLSLPLAPGKRRGELDEARARLARAKLMRVATEDEVRVEVEIARQQLLESLHALALVRDRMLPAARDQVAAARAGFEAGKVGFQAAIEAERSLRSAELRWQEMRAEVQRRRAELQQALGLVPGLAEQGEGR